MNIRDEIVVNQTVRLASDQVSVLGPNLELRDCVVVSEANSDGVAFAGAAMIGGVFDQRTPLEDFHFERVHFRGVRFVGTYSGCDFGDWDDMQKSSVTECDFSESSLNNCRFLNCEMAEIKTPSWPCFILSNPALARDFVKSKSWPRKIDMVLDIYTDTDPQCVAVVGNADVLALDSSLTAAELRTLLQEIPGIGIRD